MSNTKTHAERELDILIKTTSDAIIRHFAPEIIALCEAFGNSGQSGGSAPYTASALSQAVKKLCLQQPIAPLTGEDSEWNDVNEDIFQNNRQSSVFKEKSTGKSYFLDAIVWKGEEEHDTFTGSVDGITSRQYIKAFPFKPKTFYIDVYKDYEVEKYPENEVVAGKTDKYVYRLKDSKQLEKVFEIYDKFTPSLITN